MKYPRLRLLLTAALSLISAGVVQLGLPTVVRVPAALALVLVLPGFAATMCLFPKRPLLGFALLNYTVGISIVLTVVGGLATYVLVGLVNTQTWVIWLAGVTCLFALIGILYMTLEPSRGRSFEIRLRLDRTHLVSAVLVLSGLIVLKFAVSSSYSGAESIYNVTSFTQLWAVPGQGDDQTLQVGILNSESAPLSYHLVIQTNGVTIREWTAIALQPGETWLATVPVVEMPLGRSEIMLYRDDQPDAVYRRVEYQHPAKGG